MFASQEINSHAKDAECGGRHRRIAGGGQAQAEHPSRVCWIDHAIVPQPCACIVRPALCSVYLMVSEWSCVVLLLQSKKRKID